MLAVMAVACAPPAPGTYSSDEIDRLCIAEDRGPAEPCSVVETGQLGEDDALRYALYDLRGDEALPPMSDDADYLARLERNAVAIFERVGRNRWRPIWVDTPEDWSTVFYDTPALEVSRTDTLLYVAVGYYGTGSYNDDALLVRRSGAWRKVDSESWVKEVMDRLPPGLEIWKGIHIDPETLIAVSGLWREDDANCCPTGGEFEARLALVGETLVTQDVRYTPYDPSPDPNR